MGVEEDPVLERVREAEPIKCAHGKRPYSVSFLKILRDGERLRVMPTSLGKRKLPRFWTVWLEDLILKKTRPDQQFHVSIDNKHVLIGADGVTAKGLFATISQLVAQVHPIKVLPLKPLIYESGRRGWHHGTGLAYYWQPKYPGITVDVARVQALLPRGSSISIEREGIIKLLSHGTLPTPQHTRMWVEYFVSLDLQEQLNERGLLR